MKYRFYLLLFTCFFIFSFETSLLCTNKHFEVLNAFSSSWSAGTLQGGSGTEFYFEIIIKSKQKIIFDSIWINNRSNKIFISKKQKSISTAIQMSNKTSVLPDSDSPFLKWVAFMMGVLIVVTGIIILGVMISQGFYYFDELDLLFGLFAVVLFLAGAGLYFLASHGFDDLEEHSLVYQIGFYLSVFSPFLFFLPSLS